MTSTLAHRQRLAAVVSVVTVVAALVWGLARFDETRPAARSAVTSSAAPSAVTSPAAVPSPRPVGHSHPLVTFLPAGPCCAKENASSRLAGQTGRYVLAGSLPAGPPTGNVLSIGTPGGARATRLGIAFGFSEMSPDKEGGWGSQIADRLLTVQPTGNWRFSRHNMICTHPSGPSEFVCRQSGAEPPQPSPPPKVSESIVGTAAAPILAAAGLDEGRADIRIDNGQLTAAPIIDGLPTVGAETIVSVNQTGEILWAQGTLADVAQTENYPLTGATEAFTTLAATPRISVAHCLALEGPPYASPMQYPSTAATDGTDNNPCLSAKPISVTVTGARLGLRLQARTTRGPWLLVPTWLFTMQVDPQVPMPITAVRPQYVVASTEK